MVPHGNSPFALGLACGGVCYTPSENWGPVTWLSWENQEGTGGHLHYHNLLAFVHLWSRMTDFQLITTRNIGRTPLSRQALIGRGGRGWSSSIATRCTVRLLSSP